jgi:hypothetical protein
MPVGPSLGLATSLLDHGGASLRGATLGAFAAGAPARPLNLVLIRRLLAVLRFGGKRFGNRFVAVVVVGDYVSRVAVVRLGHCNTPG